MPRLTSIAYWVQADPLVFEVVATVCLRTLCVRHKSGWSVLWLGRGQYAVNDFKTQSLSGLTSVTSILLD